MHRPRAALAALTIAAAALASAALAAAASAQAPDVRAVATITPVRATVGDHLTLTITVDHPAGVTVTGAPSFGADFGGLELLDAVAPVTATTGAGRARTTFAYTLAAFRTGTFTVPAMTLAWAGGGAPGGSVTTPEASVTIASVLVPGDTALRPLPPQLTLADPAPWPVVPAVFVAAFALLTGGSYPLLARALAVTPPARESAPPPPPVPPAERARAALDALAAGDAGARDPAAYYAAIAGTLRRYLAARYGIAAEAMTHREVAAALVAAAEPAHAQLAAALLRQCEAVEFAGARPSADRRAADLALARELIAHAEGDGGGAAGASA